MNCDYLGQSTVADRSYSTVPYMADVDISSEDVIAQEGRYRADPAATYVMDPIRIVGDPSTPSSTATGVSTAGRRITSMLEQFLKPGEAVPPQTNGQSRPAGIGGPVFLGIAALAGVALIALSSR